MAGTSADDEVTLSSRKLGIALPAVAAACDELCVLGYVDTPQRLKAMLDSYARVLGPKAKFSVALRPLVPDCRTEDNLHAKVAAVIGHLNSGVSIPASEIYDKAGIPMISGSATNPTLTERGLTTVFRTVGRDDQQGPAIASYR